MENGRQLPRQGNFHTKSLGMSIVLQTQRYVLAEEYMVQLDACNASDQLLNIIVTFHLTEGTVNTVNTDEQELCAWVTLRKHMLTTETFWRRVQRMQNESLLRKNYFDGGWFYRADNWRKVYEPLYIANWHRAGFESIKSYSAARPREFEFIERLAKKQAEKAISPGQTPYIFVETMQWATLATMLEDFNLPLQRRLHHAVRL